MVSEEDVFVSRESDAGAVVRGLKSNASRQGKPDRGKLKIGDDWNAIRIIALSQNNPLKAIAEFVENSIDAHAKTVTITRGREHGEHYLSIKDDGDGVPRDEQGLPNFKYVATHICDSIKRRLKAEGVGNGLQGEFGIGLLSFWTVGDQLTMISPSAHGASCSPKAERNFVSVRCLKASGCSQARRSSGIWPRNCVTVSEARRFA
jgi:hypothetical protein